MLFRQLNPHSTMYLLYAATELLLMLSSLYATIYGAIYRNRFKEMKFLFIYPAASFVETFLSPIISAYLPQLSEIGISNMLINSFLLIEFAVIYHYYLQILQNIKIRIVLQIIGVTYLVGMILIWLMKSTFNKSPDIFFVPQAILILPPSFYYFIEIVRRPLKTELKSEPTFWVMIGILLYFGCTLPLFLTSGLLDFDNALDRNAYAINCVCYGLLYFLIIKAFLCKKREVH